MKILIDIGHPGHVHLFRPFTKIMLQNGHNVLFTCRQKEFEIELLESFGFKYISFGKHYNNKRGKIWGLIKFNILMLQTAIRYKPNVFLSHGSFYAAQVAWLLKKPHISFEDTFNFEQIRLYKPFTSCILSSDYKHPALGKKNINYSGYHELAYLHPKRFNAEISDKGLSERFVLLRFVSWKATHDIGHKGISFENKIKAVEEFSKYANVYISSEQPLPPELEKYKFPLPPEKMHHALANATLVFGESATMATEGAVLGVPAIYLDNTGRFYTRELEEKYGLVYNFSESPKDQLKAIDKGVQILKSDGNNENYNKKRKKLLSEKIDVTAFLVWFVENYPESFKIMKENPKQQQQFK